jgi:hypothetical protein
MRHEDAGLALWVASDQSNRDRSTTGEDPEAAQAARAIEVRNGQSVRQRAGAAVIALGERLAGDTRPVVRPGPRRRLAGQG